MKRVKQQKTLLDGYAEIGDLVYDYLTPYKDWISADCGGRKLGQFWASWTRHSGPTNQQAAESIYLLGRTRDKNPQHGTAPLISMIFSTSIQNSPN